MKKYSLALLLVGCLFFYTKVELPGSSPKLYAPLTGDDLKKVVVKSIESARHSIDLSIFSLTDREVISALNQKAEAGLDISIHYDSKHSGPLKKRLNPRITLTPWKKSSLMHQKVLIIDDHLSLIGSANFTISSLMVHDNIIMGLDCPKFAKALKINRPFSYLHNDQTVHTYHLPSNAALNHLITLIDNALYSIDAALFTLTHPKIIAALKSAHKRGVKIDLTLDSACASRFKHPELSPNAHRGYELLHEKMALIDNEIFIFGSANWTKAAFTRNRDILVIIDPLTKTQLRQVDRHFNSITH